jgi:flagellar biosynthesis protein FlhB
MSNELIFIIGLSIGALVGVVTISMFVSVRITDLHAEIRDLRVQRNLLKEELKKPKGKPTPRRKRYRKQPTRK